MTFVPASSGTGRVETSDLTAAIQPLTCLVTVMLANNETGIIQVLDDTEYTVGDRKLITIISFFSRFLSVKRECLINLFIIVNFEYAVVVSVWPIFFLVHVTKKLSSS